MSDARRAALAHLIDHAPLFPPASLPVPDALDQDRCARADDHSWLLARLVWPASRLDELEGEDRTLSVLVDDGPYSGDARAEAVETHWASGLEGLAGEAYVELPLDEELESRVSGWRPARPAREGALRWRRDPLARRARTLPSSLPRRRCSVQGDGRPAPPAGDRRAARFSERPRRVRIPGRERACWCGLADAGSAPLGRPRSRRRRARACAARAARRGRQLLVLRARRRAEGAGDPVIQGFGTFTRADGERRLGFRSRRRSSSTSPRAASTRSCRRAEGTARDRATENAVAEAEAGNAIPLADVQPVLPFTVGDYVDFYSSIEHASNVGRMFRPDAEPLLPNWRHLPVGYHGRASSVVVSGTPVRRPRGQLPPAEAAGAPRFGPSERLDIELELGFVTGARQPARRAIHARAARAHLRVRARQRLERARHQRWEYVPLGPFLGKSVRDPSRSWIVPLEALAGRRAWGRAAGSRAAAVPARRRRTGASTSRSRSALGRRPLSRAPTPAGSTGPAASSSPTRRLTAPTSAPATSTRRGRSPAPSRGTRASLIELTWGGLRPARAGRRRAPRTFLADGDTVILRGDSLGEVRGRSSQARLRPCLRHTQGVSSITSTSASPT